MPATHEELVKKASIAAKDSNVEEIEHLAETWKQFDLNGDEIIKVHEVEKFLSQLKVTLPEEKRHELVKALDKNNDGTISFIEFVHVYNDPDFRKYKCLINQ